jgi:hypothetical protein
MINDTVKKYLPEMKTAYVAPDAKVPADAKDYFDAIWKSGRDGGGVLTGRGKKMYQELNKMGYWIADTGGKFQLKAKTTGGKWVKNMSGITMWKE